MNMHKLRKFSALLGVVFLLVMFYTANAFSWGSATHAYIDDQIGKKLPLQNLNEIYGGMAADIFNFHPDALVPSTEYNYLYIQAHYNSLALWSESHKATNLGKALAFGFASHANGQLWPPYAGVYAGADYTAHGPGGNDSGFYVIDKATALWNILKLQPEIQSLNLDEATGLSISHNIIEFAIDIMVVYEMPDGYRIGKKVINSVIFRSPEFPLLLVKTYADGLASTVGMSRLEAANMIIAAERDFRKTILIYGQGLIQKSENEAINYVASLLSQLGHDIYGITVAPEVVATAIIGAQALCRPDYAAEIQETKNFVKTEMTNAGISY
ncbi:MAG: hypothetical protein ABFD82_07590 [Syntrophaceae bacterium]